MPWPAAHAVGIVHRDVKPGNILLGADGRARIADFGIAKSVQRRDLAAGPDPTGTGQWVGTPAYLSPERLNGEPATPRADIYSLGVVLYEALAGRKPFTGDTPIWTAQAILEGDHPHLGELRPDLDPALVATVERAMATDPDQRFPSATEMAQAFGRPPAEVRTEAVVPVADQTQVFGADPPLVADRTGRDSMAPADAVLKGRWRRVRIWGLVALVALVAMFLLARSADNRPADSDVSAARSPLVELAKKLRAQAARLSPADGEMAGEAARRLEEVAGRVEADDGGPAATALLSDVGEWNREGSLSDSATAAIVGLLEQVPGVDRTVLTPPPTAASRAPGSGGHERRAGVEEEGGDANDQGNGNDTAGDTPPVTQGLQATDQSEPSRSVTENAPSSESQPSSDEAPSLQSPTRQDSSDPGTQPED